MWIFLFLRCSFYVTLDRRTANLLPFSLSPCDVLLTYLWTLLSYPYRCTINCFSVGCLVVVKVPARTYGKTLENRNDSLKYLNGSYNDSVSKDEMSLLSVQLILYYDLSWYVDKYLLLLRFFWRWIRTIHDDLFSLNASKASYISFHAFVEFLNVSYSRSRDSYIIIGKIRDGLISISVIMLRW